MWGKINPKGKKAKILKFFYWKKNKTSIIVRVCAFFFLLTKIKSSVYFWCAAIFFDFVRCCLLLHNRSSVAYSTSLATPPPPRPCISSFPFVRFLSKCGFFSLPAAIVAFFCCYNCLMLVFLLSCWIRVCRSVIHTSLCSQRRRQKTQCGRIINTKTKKKKFASDEVFLRCPKETPARQQQQQENSALQKKGTKSNTPQRKKSAIYN